MSVCTHECQDVPAASEGHVWESVFTFYTVFELLVLLPQERPSHKAPFRGIFSRHVEGSLSEATPWCFEDLTEQMWLSNWIKGIRGYPQAEVSKVLMHPNTLACSTERLALGSGYLSSRPDFTTY